MLEQINCNQRLEDIFNLVEWDLDYHAKITKPNGEIVYEQLHTEFPKSWSENARNIVASKYFYGKGKKREFSLKQFITRIVRKIADEGYNYHYFSNIDEKLLFRNQLAYILLTQRAFFNTPVNFSIGVEGKRPVASACYLLAVEDNLDSILENAKTEGLVFKDGSGCGINLSSLRGANEYIGDSNGTSSGPMSFDKIYDTVAKITKSGGSCLGPDQLIFTDDGLKTVKELESLNKDFIVMSYDPLLHRFKAKIGRAYKNGKKMVYLLKTDKGEFQLTNDHYVMLAHGSYEKVENLLPNMSLMQMSSDITKQGYLRIGLKNGKKTKKSFHRLIGEDLLNATSKDNVHHKDENKLNNKLSNLEVLTQENHSLLHCNELVQKNEHVFQKRKFPKNGTNNGMHKNSSFWSNENKVSSYKEKQSLILSSSDRPKEMQKLSSKQRMINFGYKLINIGADISTFDLYFKNRKLLWNGKQGNSKEKALNLIIKYFGTYSNYYKILRENNHKVISITPLNIMDVYDIEVDCESLDDKSINSGHNFVIFGLNALSAAGKGLVVSNSRRAARMVILNDNHPDIEEFITCKAKEEEKAKALIKAGYDSAPGGEAYLSVAYQNANYTVRVSDEFLNAVKNDADWDLINVKDKEVFKTIKAKELWNLICKSAWESGDPGIQFDSTIQNWHTLPNIGRINTSNPCLHGDTIITLQNHTKIPIKIPIKDAVARSEKVYGPMIPNHWDQQLAYCEHGGIVYSGKKECIKITTETNEQISCTLNHLFPVEQFVTNIPKLKEAKDLQIGDELLVIKSNSSFDYCDYLVKSKIISIENIGEHDVYDILNVSPSNMFIANNIAVHNCSEFLHVDFSSCNLASINLLKFYDKENNHFNTEDYITTIELFTIAMNILLDFVEFPTEKIAEVTKKCRPIGLGFANLGGLLMSMGIPYDSDNGRAIASALMSAITGFAYKASAKLSQKLNREFDYLKTNRQEMLSVINNHKAHIYKIKNVNSWVEQLVNETINAFSYSITAKSFMNSQVTVLAPTGTIGIAMDCDTTGCEPELALVRYKWLVGGGTQTFTNSCIESALTNLGYSKDDIKNIIQYVYENGNIENCKLLKSEHLNVFDTSFKNRNGNRFIEPRGHVRMLGALAPFISGSASKCITGDTLIVTENGLLEIGNLYNNEEENSFSELEMLVDSDTKNVKTKYFYYGGKKDTIKLTCKDGRTIEGTPNHKIKVSNGNLIIWKRLDEITLNDFVLNKKGSNLWSEKNVEWDFSPTPSYGNQKNVTIPQRMTEELAWFLGCYIAEGNKNKSNWTIVITNNNQKVLDRANLVIKNLFNIDAKIVFDKRNNVGSVIFASKAIYEFLLYLGCDGLSGDKQIPWSILQSTKNCIQQFISALWLDGFVASNRISICLKSKKLINQLQIIFDNFGIYSSIFSKYNKIYDRYYWQLDISGRTSIEKFKDLFILDDEWKMKNIFNILKSRLINQNSSSVIPLNFLRSDLQDKILLSKDTMNHRSVFDKRTKYISRDYLIKNQKKLQNNLVNFILDNGIYFSSVEKIENNINEVFDFSVPENQTFIGNGIINHNTVNLPESATIEDISDIYMMAHELGVKCVAVYRDNCKASQPMSTEIKEGNKGLNQESNQVNKESISSNMSQDIYPNGKNFWNPNNTSLSKTSGTRSKLNNTRRSITHKFDIDNHEFYVTVGLYDDGTPGELFITASKEGSFVRGIMDSFATIISIALQYGVPLSVIIDKLKGSSFEPSGYTNNTDIKTAKSVVDYLAKYLQSTFIDNSSVNGINFNENVLGNFTTGNQFSEPISSNNLNNSTGDVCSFCGNLLVLVNKCKRCLTCGEGGGCGE